MEDFKIGDVVQVADGPLMTVNDTSTNIVECIWFDVNLKINKEQFKKAVLVKSHLLGGGKGLCNCIQTQPDSEETLG